MRIRRPGMVCLLCVLVSMAAGCTRTRPGERIVVKDVYSAIWSKDGQALYYAKNGDIYRYDVTTGRRRVHRIGKVEQGFDLSPDERRIVFQRQYEGIYIAELGTGRVSLAHPTEQSVLDVNWPCAKQIAFSVMIPERSRTELFLLDTSNGSVSQFAESTVRFASREDGGIVYVSKNKRYHYHDLNDGTDKVLPSCPAFDSDDDVYFLYLDRHRAIYNVWRTGYMYTEIVDLGTMRTRRIVLPEAHPNMVLSPNLTKFWYSGPYHTDKEPLKLYLVDVPPQTVKQLKAPVK